MDRIVRRLASLSLLWALVQPATAAQPAMQTWHPWQLDSLLAAWALSQSVRPAPVFESVPRGQPIAPARAIDTPDSSYRRIGQRTAFEEAVRLSKLEHACVGRLRDAVRVVELAPWRKPEHPAVEAFEARVLQALPSQPQPGGLAPAFEVVEGYCRQAPPP